MREWHTLPSVRPAGTDPLTLGLIALSVDRACVGDCDRWLAPFDDVTCFSTRVPMSSHTTPHSLRAMGDHLATAASLLVPGTRLDVVAFACTSGAVAIGIERVQDQLRAGRPGVPVITPMTAGVSALRGLGARRISLLVPYEIATADLVADYFEAEGFLLDRCTSLELPGDPEMNALTTEQLHEAGMAAMHPSSDALFVSCTGLATSGLVEPLEAQLDLPVVTSNQAMIWQMLRAAGHPTIGLGRGSLFRSLHEMSDV